VALGATTWTVDQDIRAAAEGVRSRFGGSWNSYEGHGLSPAHGQRRTIDHWGPAGRGDPLAEHVGDAMCAWILGQHQVKPVAVLIWWSWWWRPRIGWEPYTGFQGNHGPGVDAHIHVGYL
jgi:hypothetical protein